MQKVRFTFSTATVICLLFLTGCGSTTPSLSTMPSPTEHKQPRGIDLSFRWITTPEFDPLSSEGTFVRAYVESYELARDGIGTEWGYPGFADASPPNIEQMLKTNQLGVDYRATQFYRLLRRLSGPSSTTITLCRYGEGTVFSKKAWWYSSWKPIPISITFTTADADPPAGERGSRRAPALNVFGGWKTTSFELFPADSYDVQPSLVQQCQDDVRGLPLLPPHKPQKQSDPFTPLPPSPGWPDAGL